MFYTPIKSRVMQAINKRIQDAEDLFKDKCLSIDENLENDIKDLELRAKNDKIEFANKLVEDILSL
jgi:hypothetical protein